MNQEAVLELVLSAAEGDRVGMGQLADWLEEKGEVLNEWNENTAIAGIVDVTRLARTFRDNLATGKGMSWRTLTELLDPLPVAPPQRLLNLFLTHHSQLPNYNPHGLTCSLMSQCLSEHPSRALRVVNDWFTYNPMVRSGSLFIVPTRDVRAYALESHADLVGQGAVNCTFLVNKESGLPGVVRQFARQMFNTAKVGWQCATEKENYCLLGYSRQRAVLLGIHTNQ